MDQPDYKLNRRSLLREERHPNAVTAPPVHRGSMAPRPWRGFWNSLGTAALLPVVKLPGSAAPGQRAPAEALEPWQQAAKRRRTLFLLLTLVSTVLATALFADMQPNYDNAFLQYGQLALFALLSAWVVTGFMTAMMGFYVTLFGDAHTLSAKQVQHHALDKSTRTAIIMPICNEDVRTVFAGLRATCESVALSAANWPASPTSRRSKSITACANAAPTARPATWPTSAAAGARTTATWWYSTPTA